MVINESADWENLVLSTKEGIPNLPIINNHSGGHYRSWVNKLIARSFLKQIKHLDQNL